MNSAWTVAANVDFFQWTVHPALFMDPQISFFINFFIKNGSHSTIYTFKNYFATVILAISFQFQQNKSYPNTPLEITRTACVLFHDWHFGIWFFFLFLFFWHVGFDMFTHAIRKDKIWLWIYVQKRLYISMVSILLFKRLSLFGFLIFLVQKCPYTPMFK